MRFMIAILFGLSFIAVGQAREVPAYRGADAGHLVFAMAARSPLYTYRLNVRKKGEISDQYFEYEPGSLLFGPRPDFQEPNESGKVITRAMPPGEYEIYNFLIMHVANGHPDTWRSRADFSIPFTIKPGETTYLGNFSSVALKSPNVFGFGLVDGAYFIISDKSARDLPIAKDKKDAPAKGDVTNAVPDPAAVNNFFIRSAPVLDSEKVPEPYPGIYRRL